MWPLCGNIAIETAPLGGEVHIPRRAVGKILGKTFKIIKREALHEWTVGGDSVWPADKHRLKWLDFTCLALVSWAPSAGAVARGAWQSPFIQEQRLNTLTLTAGLWVGLAAFGWAHPAQADVVTAWHQTASHAVVASGAGGAVQARAMAIVHAAIYAAVNAIERRHTVYTVDVKAPPGASREAAGATAA
jgi:hypothetical protein